MIIIEGQTHTDKNHEKLTVRGREGGGVNANVSLTVKYPWFFYDFPVGNPQNTI